MENHGRRMEMNETLIQLNAKRTALIAWLALLFQCANVVMGGLKAHPSLIAGCLLLLTASGVYLGLGYRLRKYAHNPFRALRNLYRAYSVAFALGMLPFLLSDAAAGAVANSILFLMVFLFTPLFSFQENKVLFFLVALYPAAAAAFFSQNVWYVCSVAGLSAAGGLLCYSLHGGYLEIITSLRMESDLDDLTQLFSRKAGMSRMHALMALCKRMGRPVAVFYIDIDCFKNYNDTFGHLAGDHALMEVAGCMRRCFARETDVLCRLGGEEFVVMIPVAKTSAAFMMAKRLIHMVSDVGMAAGKDANANVVTVSIGVAVMEEGDVQATVQNLVDEADRQLYIAKTSGRNCIAHGGRVVYRNAWA